MRPRPRPRPRPPYPPVKKLIFRCRPLLVVSPPPSSAPSLVRVLVLVPTQIIYPPNNPPHLTPVSILPPPIPCCGPPPANFSSLVLDDGFLAHRTRGAFPALK